jgi:hypothetical protein
MLRKKVFALTISTFLVFSSVGISHADQSTVSENYIAESGKSLKIRHKNGHDNFDLTNLKDGQSRRLKISDGSFRTITGLSKIGNPNIQFVSIQNNSNFDLITTTQSNATLMVEDFDASELLGADGHAKLVLDPNISHRFELRSELSVSQAPSPIATTTQDSGLVQVSIISLTTQPIAMIIAPELPDYTRFRYQTYIADRLVAVPSFGCWVPWVPGAESYFKGNSRSWAAGSTNNKTAFDFRVNWLTGKITNVSRYVEKTQIVNVFPLTNSEYLGESETASSSSMAVSFTNSQSVNQKTFQMRQDVSNPFCASLGIYYDLIVSVKRSGSYTVFGEIRKVPNHEFYIRDSNSVSWTTVYRYSNVGFYCLTPGAICIDVIDKTGVIQ